MSACNTGAQLTKYSSTGTLWPMNDNIPLAAAYYINGSNFRASAERLVQGIELDGSGRPTKLTAVPLYFLASHAAELFLKAALLKRGFSEADLKKKHDYRHNLAALLREIEGKGVPVSNDTVVSRDSRIVRTAPDSSAQIHGLG
jgi:hypothetical protein